MVPFSSIIFIWSIFSVAYAISIEPRIIGGEPAATENFSYLISLQKNGRHACGGGIIAKRFILTAAHCVADSNGELYRSQLTIVAGTTDLKMSTEYRRVEVQKIYVPRSYKSAFEFTGDIAVLKLKEDLDLSHDLSKLDLPTMYDQDYVGQVAKVAGYGWTVIGNRERGYSDYILRYLNVTIISNKECRRKFGISEDNVNLIPNLSICAQALPQHAGNPAGVCKGDSGSPLVIGNTVVGVSNLGPRDCNEEEKAAVYCRVSNFLIFVKNALDDDVTDGMKSYDFTAKAGVQDNIYYPENKK